MLTLVSMSFAQVTVTINLDMLGTDYDESLEDLYYSGDVIVPWGHESGLGWAQPGTKPELKFSDNGDGTYTLVLDTIKPGWYWMDFYREDEGGTGWGTNGEWSGAPMGLDQNIYVGTEDVTFNSKWGDFHDLTLNVDMNDVTEFDAANDTVYFFDAGHTKLNGTPLTDDDEDGIYTISWDSIPQAHYVTIFGYGSLNANPDEMTYEWADTTNELIGTRVITMEFEDLDKTYIFGEAEAWVPSSAKAQEVANVSLYPSISNGHLQYEVDGIYNLEIIDITGKVVYTDVIERIGSLDISDNHKGVYFARFISGNKVATHKIIIQ